MTLPPFNPAATCAKCGSRAVLKEYRPPRGKILAGSEVLADAMPEHVRRKCGECGYDWAEAPLDATAKAEAT